ncbi:MAG: acetate/propionate family kinase [Acidimicrobiales bacterium]
MVLGRLMRLLVANAGSSSTKLSVLDSDGTILGHSVVEHSAVPAPEGPVVDAALAGLLRRFAPDATVHRVVHGGSLFDRAVVVDESIEAELAALGDLAPLHNPPALAPLDRARALSPELPAVACFDTTFFADLPPRTSPSGPPPPDLPPEAATYAIPAMWRDNYGIRRYGFHGLSHAWAARRGAELAGRPLAELAVVTAHLGAGASLSSVVEGAPVDTTMRFTPLEGLVMATRSGSVDPGVLTFLLRHAGVSPGELDDALEHRSGLLSLAGTPDLRVVIDRADAGDGAAALAYAVYLHHLCAGIAAMAAAAGGLDLLVFTGGAGEASARLRSDACRRLGFLGLAPDEGRNHVSEGGTGGGAKGGGAKGGGAKGGGAGCADRIVSSGPSGVAVAVVRAREDLEMAGQARAVLAGMARVGGPLPKPGSGARSPPSHDG